MGAGPVGGTLVETIARTFCFSKKLQKLDVAGSFWQVELFALSELLMALSAVTQQR